MNAIGPWLGALLPAGISGFSAPIWLAILLPVAAAMLIASLTRISRSRGLAR